MKTAEFFYALRHGRKLRPPAAWMSCRRTSASPCLPAGKLENCRSADWPASQSIQSVNQSINHPVSQDCGLYGKVRCLLARCAGIKPAGQASWLVPAVKNRAWLCSIRHRPWTWTLDINSQGERPALPVRAVWGTAARQAGMYFYTGIRCLYSWPGLIFT